MERRNRKNSRDDNIDRYGRTFSGVFKFPAKCLPQNRKIFVSTAPREFTKTIPAPNYETETSEKEIEFILGVDYFEEDKFYFNA